VASCGIFDTIRKRESLADSRSRLRDRSLFATA
jgi:hypothetical protein